jgi:alpha-mannosidase
MKLRISLAIALFSVSSCFLFSQVNESWPSRFFKGYTRSVTTGKFSYHSPQPDVTTSLLLRSIDSASFISWETEAIPTDFNQPSAAFIWMFGIDANPESHHYRLYVNGSYCLSFANPVLSELKSWEVTGIDGSMLTFLTTMLDKYDDPMGYAVFELPRKYIRKGQPQVIKIIGESAGSNVWYMTFESAVEEKIDIVQEEAVIREKGKEYYPVLFNFVHLGNPVKGKLEIKSAISTEFTLQPGFNQVKLLLPANSDTSGYIVVISIGNQQKQNEKFFTHPVRHWMLYLVEHTHTDIGYTRPQTEILPEHLRYIDYALDYCDQTDSLPDDARFRWTCETSWAVREYIRTRPPSQIERLKRRVQEGRIEVTGLFLNSSDLSDEASVAASLQPVKEFRDAGIPVNAAMQDDVNGVPWCLADYLNDAGINFLSMGQNDSRALKPFNRPTTFWWESPSGKKIMVDRPEHYMWGNQLGILTNKETFGKGLFIHLQDIETKKYPFDHYAIHFSGYLIDNSPPSTSACGMVKSWNEQYVWPKLRLATISEFGEYMAKNHASELQTCRGAWPDWWMDGFGSAALETSYTRMSHADYIANLGLMSMAIIMGAVLPDKLFSDLHQIEDDIAFYDEHTFGAAESISDPLVENSVVQWGEKSAYAWEAVKKNRILREELMGVIQPKLQKSKEPSITVLNTLNWKRSGEVTVFIDHQVVPKDKPFRIIDEDGTEVPVQLAYNREDGTYWTLFVRDIPPMGYRTYRIFVSQTQLFPAPPSSQDKILENALYKITIDLVKGGLTSVFDKAQGKELVFKEAPWQLGQFIYEQLGKNRHQLEVLKLDDYTRTPWQDITASGITEGSVWKSLVINGKSPLCADKDGISCEVRLYNTEKKIELLYSMKKLAVTDPEGVYIAFPFDMPGGHLTFEVQGGTVIPGKDQLEGSASDWDGIQNFVSVKNNNSQIVFVSPEIPLVQLGGINLGQFSRIAHPASLSIYSWVLNNYWTTNFRASQEGELKWTYRITSSADTSNGIATRFGWGERVPFITRVFPGSGRSERLEVKTFLGQALGNVLLVSAMPGKDAKSVILHLREIRGNQETIDISGLIRDMHTRKAVEVNVLNEKVMETVNNLELKPFETRFLRIEF